MNVSDVKKNWAREKKITEETSEVKIMKKIKLLKWIRSDGDDGSFSQKYSELAECEEISKIK